MWNDKKNGWEENGMFIPAFDWLAWYAAPTQLGPSRLDFRPQDLALALANARCNHGRAPARSADMRSLNSFLGVPNAAPENLRSGQTKDAEDLLEEVRKQVRPEAPSRLECYFVSASHDVAQIRLNELRGERGIFRCRILKDGYVFPGDIRLFQRVCDSQRREDAERYWVGADLETTDPSHVEYLVGGSLYFPDWETIPDLDLGKIIDYQSLREFCRENNLSMDGWFGPNGPIR
ncbi:DUF2441 domain-containing protein [Noviherbaspirillum sp. CPCC 100848]|uniref:DUF2441 domain-containing protein n=1 Tax=Noviherbaspirillum album TaxID=3080276 RepID=A0ABU6J4E6_9BURK|nr:DUF2441 domain-containing protein [Noviherbaspirillum sp. CPCC 100848]MEC4718395.1 DUF2441 domain-containing protein [Noviherbaspirillum sp. CPCC 100848]